MTLSDLASVGSFVSGVAVLISLIYLAFQIRQNTLTHRAAAFERRQEFAKEQIHMLIDPNLASVSLKVGRGVEDVSEVECMQYFQMQCSFLVGMDHLIWLHRNDILDEDTFQAQFRLLQHQLGAPGMRAAWQMWKPLATPAFRKIVEEQLTTLQPRPTGQFFETWKKAFQAAKHDRLAA